MRVLRNIFFLYLSLFGGLILNFIQLKLLSLYLEPLRLGEFFTINAFGEIASYILLLGAPFVLIRYLPKFQAEGEKRKLSSLLNVLALSYLLLSMLMYVVLHFFGYRLGMGVYKDEVIGKYLSFGFLVSFAITLFWLIFMAFNGLRKMYYASLLNLFYLTCLTLSLFVFRERLSVLLVLKIYLISVLPSIFIGAFLLYREFRSFGGVNFKLVREVSSYWKYAVILGILSPLFSYLDRLLVGYFLTIPMVAVFTIAAKIRGWTARVLDIPIQALTPEMSYSWEKGGATSNRKEVLGVDLGLVVKVYFFVTLILATPILIGGKEIIQIISSYKYLGAFVPLCFLIFSTILASLYAPIATAMRAIGKIELHLCSNIIWILGYAILILFLIPKLGIAGVGIAHLLATVVTLIFNFGYVVKYHTKLKIEVGFFYKTVGFALLFGTFTYFIWQYAPCNLIWRIVLLYLFVGLGYLLLLFRTNIFCVDEKKRLQDLFTGRYGFLSRILT